MNPLLVIRKYNGDSALEIFLFDWWALQTPCSSLEDQGFESCHRQDPPSCRLQPPNVTKKNMMFNKDANFEVLFHHFLVFFYFLSPAFYYMDIMFHSKVLNVSPHCLLFSWTWRRDFPIDSYTAQGAQFQKFWNSILLYEPVFIWHIDPRAHKKF